MYQQVTIIGRVGQPPELRYTQSGQPVASFSVAVNKSWTTQDGQKQERASWFRIACWRQLAETVSKHVTKGMQVMVVGELAEPNAYVDRDGNPRASLELTASTVRFLGSRADNQNGTAPAAVGEQQGAQSQPTTEEEIPF